MDGRTLLMEEITKIFINLIPLFILIGVFAGLMKFIMEFMKQDFNYAEKPKRKTSNELITEKVFVVDGVEMTRSEYIEFKQFLLDNEET